MEASRALVACVGSSYAFVVDLDLQGSVVFVTGASGSIGNEICRAFLDEGALVAAFSRHGMPDGDPERTISLCGDVRDPDSIDQAIRATAVAAAIAALVGAPASGQFIHHNREMLALGT